MTAVVEMHDITKVYGEGEAEVRAVDGISLTVEPGEYVAIMGASGSGKSTVMNIIGALDVATSGTYKIDGVDIGDLDDDALSLVRNRRIGFIFQAFNLIPRMSAASNVELPLMYRGVRRSERRRRALDALAKVGLADRSHHQPNELSGGQQQRVAVARALAMEPSLMLADEPTGNLDSRSTADVLDLLDEIHTEGKTIVIITHEDDVAERAGRVVTLRDGKVESDVLAAAR
ncbi:MAG: ABC transporter ATP-binding protein [Candidatus Nanopelagicales bacterium]|nr:ABC transporter ATP-binding protein [Candidatus Nanopelagicales bacterium]